MPATAGTLYLVSTPIGNLADLSPRALEALGGAAVIYAEDTRRTLKLVRHFDLQTSLVSLHAHNEAERTGEVLSALAAGSDCALVTDAGTPGVSDPGAGLVRAVADAGHAVIPIPGPSAVLAALAASGFGADQFAFLGFPPRSGRKREEWLRRCADLGLTIVAFESPRRVGKLLADLAATGLSETPACVCRELTKIHEETRRGTVSTLAAYYGEAEVRGEVTLVLDGAAVASGTSDEMGTGSDAADAERREAAEAAARSLAADGATTREIAKALKRDFGLARNVAYETALGAGASSQADDQGAAEGERG